MVCVFCRILYRLALALLAFTDQFCGCFVCLFLPQNSVGKHLRSGKILVPLPKRLRRTGKRVVEGNQDAPSMKESWRICFEAKYPSEFFDRMACSHRFCSSCMALHIRGKLQENSRPIHCPEPSCSENLIPQISKAILSKLTIEKWKLALTDVENPISQRSCCPFEDSLAPLLKDVPEARSSTAAAAVVIKKSKCPHCARLICVQCGVPWHEGLDCTEIKKVSPREEEKGDMALFKLAKEKDWQQCPKCKHIVEKTCGCLHIMCRVPCEYPGQNMAIKVDESSAYPNFIAIKFLYEGGQTDISAVEVARVGQWRWYSMSPRKYSAVWEIANSDSFDGQGQPPFQFRKECLCNKTAQQR